MKQNNRFFIAMLSIIMGTVFLVVDNTNAATARPTIRVSTTSRRPATAANLATVSTTQTTSSKQEIQNEVPVETVAQTKEEKNEEPEEIIIENKSSGFDISVSAATESSVNDNSFAEQIRKQRAAYEAIEATTAVTTAQQTAIRTSSNTCDRDLRKCMANKCGNDFTKCALDGDTAFGDKLNLCRRDTECTGEEFRLFTTEIKADRDMNVRLASYNNVIECGNQYNACLVNECGKTYNKCLGKEKADAATKKCESIAKECVEADSGLANRFGTAIGKLRENAEKEVKRDDERMYAMRDSMQSVCKRMGAMFDERTFDCIFTVNFFAGDNQREPMASRKRYAGDTFVCMQEWFGINATTYKENAYRETRAQTGASSAMLGSGVGTAVGLVTSGAIGRSLDTQKAKKELDKEKKAQQADNKNAKKNQNNTDDNQDDDELDNNADQDALHTPEEADNRTIDDVVDSYNKNAKGIMDQANANIDSAGIPEWKRNANEKYELDSEMTPNLTTSDKGMGSLGNTSASDFFGSGDSSSDSGSGSDSSSSSGGDAGGENK